VPYARHDKKKANETSKAIVYFPLGEGVVKNIFFFKKGKTKYLGVKLSQPIKSA